IHLIWGHGSTDAALRSGGGILGQSLASALSALLSSLGAFVGLLGLVVAGLLLMFNTSLRTLLSPATAGGRLLAGAVAGRSASARRPEGAIAVQPEPRPDASPKPARE